MWQSNVSVSRGLAIRPLAGTRRTWERGKNNLFNSLHSFLGEGSERGRGRLHRILACDGPVVNSRLVDFVFQITQNGDSKGDGVGAAGRKRDL